MTELTGNMSKPHGNRGLLFFETVANTMRDRVYCLTRTKRGSYSFIGINFTIQYLCGVLILGIHVWKGRSLHLRVPKAWRLHGPAYKTENPARKLTQA